MPEREELILEIRTELDRARSEVTDLERQLLDLEEGFKDAGSAADKAASDIVAMAQDADTRLRDAKAAADALAQALGPELAASIDIKRAVAGFEDMGVSLKEVEERADVLATALRQVDDIKMQQVNDGLRQMDDGVRNTTSQIGELGNRSNQSKSVLANLTGNAAQDLGQLGGVAGSAGVAIGQLAEYAVDGNIKLNQLAKVAAPMLGVAAAATLIGAAIQGIKAEQAFRADLAEDFEESLRDAQTAAEGLLNTLRETGQLDVSQPGGIFNLGQQTEDLIPVLDRFGLGFQDFMELVNLSLTGNTEALDAFYAQLGAGHFPIGDYQEGLGALANGVDQYADAIRTAEEGQRIFNDFMSGTANTVDEANAAFVSFGQEQRLIEGHWDNIIRDLQENGELTRNSTTAWNALQTILGLTNEEMAEMAGQKLDERLQAEAEAAEEAADAEREHAEALAEASDALADIASNFDVAASRAAGFQSALDQMNDGSQLTSTQETIGFADALHTLHERLHDLDDVLTDEEWQNIDLVPDTWDEIVNMPEELGPVVEALSAFREHVQSELTEAFEQGGASEARQWAEDTAQTVIDELERAGIESGEQVAEILAALGLLPEQVEIAIDIAEAEQARTILNDISSVIDTLPPEVQLKIAAIAADDPVAALQAAINALGTSGVTVPAELQLVAADLGAKVLADKGAFGLKDGALAVEATISTDADMAPADATVDAWIAEERLAPITAEAEITEADTDLDTLADEDRTAIILAKAHVAQADLDLNALAADERHAVIDADANTAQADRDLDALAAQTRLAAIDAFLRSFPSESSIRSAITGGAGRITVPIVGVWSTRIEGSRPI